MSWLPLLALTIAPWGVAHAQGAPEPSNASSPETLEEITVTAQRRPEKLQSVPAAVTALSGEELASRQVYDIQSLQYAVPSMLAKPTPANPLTSTISLRGWGEPDPLPTIDPTVGLYLDGVYIARATGANLELVDMQRVEVVRGPQGTLFGRDAIAGAINLVPNRPQPQYSATLDAALGNYDTRELTAVLNAPLTAHAALRIAGKHTEHDGYGEAVLLGLPLSSDDTDYLRTQLQLDLPVDWQLNLAYDLTWTRMGSQRIGFLSADSSQPGVPPQADLEPYRDLAPRYVQDNRAGNLDAHVWGVAATLTTERAGLVFDSITAYRHLNITSWNTDADGTPYDLRAVPHRDQAEHQFSQEFQLRNDAGPMGLNWLAGLLYFEENADFDNDIVVAQSPNTYATRGTARNSSASAYLQGDVPLGPALRFNAGLRYNVDWRQLISRNAVIAGGSEICLLDPSIVDAGQGCQATLPDNRYSYVPFNLGLDYTLTDNALLYARFGRGYRSGGYNARGGTPTDLLSFGPENVTSYELGAKSEFLHEKLRSNLALYRADYGDAQLAYFASQTQLIRQNAGQARVQGLELELAGLIERVQLTATVGLSEGHFTQLSPNAGASLDDKLALPRTTWSLATELPLRLGAGTLRLHADYAWRSDDHDGSYDQRCQCHNAYGLLNARADFELRGGALTLGLWGRNLGNTRYMAESVDYGYLMISIPGDPRTYGASLSYHFGAHAADP